MAATCFYSILRLTPHPIRRESINLGVVLVTEDGRYADFRFATAYKLRLQAVAPDVHPRIVKLFYEDFERRMGRTLGGRPTTGSTTITLNELSAWSDVYASQFEFTDPRPLEADNPATSLDELFQTFVVPPAKKVRGVLDRPTIRRHLRRALRDWSIPPESVVEAPPLPVIHGTNSLDLGVLGDGRVAVAIEPISFQLRTSEGIIRQRDHVAWVKQDLRANTTLKVCAALTEPTEANEHLYLEAKALLHDLDVTTFEVEQVGDLRPILAEAGIALE